MNLRFGSADIGADYQKLMEEAAKSYAEGIFEELREHGYDPDLMRLYVMGGGAHIIKLVGDYDKERVTFDHDIRANAKGYELLLYEAS